MIFQGKGAASCVTRLCLLRKEKKSGIIPKEADDVEHFTDKWHEPMMQFCLDVAKDSENFPKRVLALLDRHFGFHRSIFFPFPDPALSNARTGQKSGAPSNYITFGIRYAPMYDYKDHGYREDIFHYGALPKHLRGQRVVYTEDIMPYAQYARTPYGTHMIAEEMDYQAVLFLYAGERVLGSLGLFRDRREGRFTEEERPLLDYLARLIEANYQNFLRHSGEARFHDSFRLFFQGIQTGAILLNQDMTVVQCNTVAKEISEIFWEQYRRTQGHILHSNYQGESQFQEVQTMVNEINERLSTHGGSSQTFTSMAGDITFFHTSFLSSGAAGIVQTWHLMLITNDTKALPETGDHPYHSLTQQERRIVFYLANGRKNEQIAEELHISIYTVRTHIANIYKKFEVNNKVDLLMRLQSVMKDRVDWDGKTIQ